MYDGLLALRDRNANSTVRQEYTWGLNLGGGIGGLLNLRKSGLDYAYLYDGKGNVEAVLDGSQNVMAAYRYDPFGDVLAKSGSFEQPFQFSTKRFNELTGLSYYGYRFYAADMGRWITRDPLGEAGGINLYAFVGNNPVNWIDPFGLWVMNNSGPWILDDKGKLVRNDSSSCTVFIKPAGKNDYDRAGIAVDKDDLLFEGGAFEVPPGTCSLEPFQDGVGSSDHPDPKKRHKVLKTADRLGQINVTVNKDCSFTYNKWKNIGGGWKDRKWQKKEKAIDWEEIFKAVEEKAQK